MWDGDLFVLLNGLLFALLYIGGVRRVSRSGAGPWPRHRTALFLLAVALLLFAYLGPFGSWGHTLFWPHMMQHLVVMMVAAPLIVLSSPVRLIFLNLNGNGRRRMVGVLRSRPMMFLIQPWFGWSLFAVVLLGTHLPIVMNNIIESHDAMAFIERPLYLIAALIFYYPLIGSDLIAKRPPPSIRLASLALMMIPETILGMVVHFAPVPLYSAYAVQEAVTGIDPLTDQKFSGALMWAIAMVLDGMWMMLAGIEWWRDQERATELQERRERKDVTL